MEFKINELSEQTNGMFTIRLVSNILSADEYISIARKKGVDLSRRIFLHETHEGLLSNLFLEIGEKKDQKLVILKNSFFGGNYFGGNQLKFKTVVKTALNFGLTYLEPEDPFVFIEKVSSRIFKTAGFSSLIFFHPPSPDVHGEYRICSIDPNGWKGESWMEAHPVGFDLKFGPETSFVFKFPSNGHTSPPASTE